MKDWSESALIFRDFEKTYPVVERGEGVYLYHENGKKYIDASSGSAAVSNIGHGVAEVAQAIETEIHKFAYCPSHYFANRPAIELAERLAALTPEGLTKVWLVSDGSEATEAAVKLARQFQILMGHRSKYLVISRWKSYHGATMGALSWSGIAARRRIYQPLFKETPHIPPAYCYRCDFGKSYPECGLLCATVLEKTIQQVGAEYVAAFIAEPVVGAALGAVPPPDEYFPIIREICDKYEVVFIADEVMTGFGRTGEMFGIDHWNIVPDMIACAKGISGGYVPLGAVLAHEKILEKMKKRKSNIVTGHTYSAHHVLAASALASIEYILDNDLVRKANEYGGYLFKRMKSLLEHPIVGDIRGKGLFMGIEFVKDKATKAPFDFSQKIADRIGAESLRRGLIVYPGFGSVDGTLGDHILLAPPLIISRSEIDQIALILDESIQHIAHQVVP